MAAFLASPVVSSLGKLPLVFPSPLIVHHFAPMPIRGVFPGQINRAPPTVTPPRAERTILSTLQNATVNNEFLAAKTACNFCALLFVLISEVAFAATEQAWLFSEEMGRHHKAITTKQALPTGFWLPRCVIHTPIVRTKAVYCQVQHRQGQVHLGRTERLRRAEAVRIAAMATCCSASLRRG